MKNQQLKNALEKFNGAIHSGEMHPELEFLGESEALSLSGGKNCPDKCFINTDKKKGNCFVNKCRQNCKKNTNDTIPVTNK